MRASIVGLLPDYVNIPGRICRILQLLAPLSRQLTVCGNPTIASEEMYAYFVAVITKLLFLTSYLDLPDILQKKKKCSKDITTALVTRPP